MGINEEKPGRESFNLCGTNASGDINLSSSPESYRPERVPKVIELVAKYKDEPGEVTLKEINNRCSIVYRPAMNIVGIKTVLTSESNVGFLNISEKYIKNGTIDILEKMLVNQQPGKYVGILTDNAGGGSFTYIIGIEVESFEDLPEALPENTVICKSPGGNFAKIGRNEGEGEYDLWDYFTGDFRRETEYIYDKELLSYQILDKNAEVIYAYEPVKIPQTEDEKYDTISFKIVTLPEIKFAGIKSDITYGVDIITRFFTEYETTINSLSSRQLYVQDYIGFPLHEDGVMYSCFGVQVENFDGLPKGIDTVELKGGLYVCLTQLEINNDNPAALFGAVDKVFFEENPEYERDKVNCDLVRFHQGHSASIYVPIKKVEV